METPSIEEMNLQEWQRVMRLAEGYQVMLQQIVQEILSRPTKDPAATGIEAGSFSAP